MDHGGQVRVIEIERVDCNAVDERGIEHRESLRTPDDTEDATRTLSREHRNGKRHFRASRRAECRTESVDQRSSCFVAHTRRDRFTSKTRCEAREDLGDVAGVEGQWSRRGIACPRPR